MLYREIFDRRGASYAQAHAIAPHARESERKQALDRLRLTPRSIVCDMPSGAGYAAAVINRQSQRE